MAGQGSGLRTLFIVLGILGGVVLLVCTGFIGLGVWGIGMVTDHAMAALNHNPVVQQRVGEITEMDVDWSRSTLEEGDDVFVFEFKGTKATGFVTAEIVTTDVGGEKVVAGTIGGRTPAAKL